MTKRSWRIIYRILRFTGFVGCLATGLLSMAFIGYYSENRPHVPQIEHNWTVRLYWSVSPPSYGTAAENHFLFSLFWTGFSFFVIIALGEAIRIHKLGGWRKQ